MASRRLWTPGTTLPPLQRATTPGWLPGDSPQTSRGSLRSLETVESSTRAGSVISSDDPGDREEREKVALGEALVFLTIRSK